MRKFDTKVQHLKYKVLREVARLAWEDKLLESILDVPQKLIPGKEATMRCCVYKERAILGERVKLAMGGDKTNPNVIEVIEIACDECPVGGYEVTNACRGCLAATRLPMLAAVAWQTVARTFANLAQSPLIAIT